MPGPKAKPPPPTPGRCVQPAPSASRPCAAGPPHAAARAASRFRQRLHSRRTRCRWSRRLRLEVAAGPPSAALARPDSPVRSPQAGPTAPGQGC
eukprot:10671546-Lingulodinium_polyedra.AAC.1